MKIVRTYTAQVFVGLRHQYSAHVYPLSEVLDLCQWYVDREGLGVTVTPTNFVYTHGQEPGAVIGLVHYPRFPLEDPESTLRHHALELGESLRQRLCQYRVSVVFPDETVLLEEKES